MTPARKSWSRNDKGEAASEECGFRHAIEEGFLEGVIGHTVPPTGLAVVFAAIVVCCRCCIVTGVHRLGNPLHAVILANNGGEYDGKHNIQIGRYAIPPPPSDLGGELRRCRKYHLDDAAFEKCRIGRDALAIAELNGTGGGGRLGEGGLEYAAASGAFIGAISSSSEGDHPRFG